MLTKNSNIQPANKKKMIFHASKAIVTVIIALIFTILIFNFTTSQYKKLLNSAIQTEKAKNLKDIIVKIIVFALILIFILMIYFIALFNNIRKTNNKNIWLFLLYIVCYIMLITYVLLITYPYILKKHAVQNDYKSKLEHWHKSFIFALMYSVIMYIIFLSIILFTKKITENTMTNFNNRFWETLDQKLEQLMKIFESVGIIGSVIGIIFLFVVYIKFAFYYTG